MSAEVVKLQRPTSDLQALGSDPENRAGGDRGDSPLRLLLDHVLWDVDRAAADLMALILDARSHERALELHLRIQKAATVLLTLESAALEKANLLLTLKGLR